MASFFFEFQKIPGGKIRKRNPKFELWGSHMVYILQTTVVTIYSYQETKVRTLTPKSYISFAEASEALQNECALIDSHYKINNLYESRKIKLKLRLIDDDSRKVILINYTNDNFETVKIYTMQILKTSS